MKIENLSVEQIKQGYVYDPAAESYTCIICGKTFNSGEIYQINSRFFTADKAVQKHMETEHSEYLSFLLKDESKYNTLTENQKQLLKLFASSTEDKEISEKLGITASTVRHQKFIFREKAKQAKFYLAVYERAFENKESGENAIVPIHDHARMVDERYVITEKERNRILETCFYSLEPLKLKNFPPKEKKKVVILTKIWEQFEGGRKYSEKEVNKILADVYDDFVTIRRYLIEYGFMDRTKDGSKYWLT